MKEDSCIEKNANNVTMGSVVTVREDQWFAKTFSSFSLINLNITTLDIRNKMIKCSAGLV